jgi:GNAT superfamily N-acetyltransferase
MRDAGLLDIALSDIDERRFGYRTAKASRVTLDAVPEMLAFCRDRRVQLLIVRCSAADIRVAQALERAGCQLMDTLIYYTRSLTRTPPPSDTGRFPVRPMPPGEADSVSQVAAEAFRDYKIGHYHADPRLDPAACDAVYASWAHALCLSRGASSEVLVAGKEGTILGFGAVRLNNPLEGEGVLFGLAPAAQGFGIYTSLVIKGMEWCKEKGARRFIISTQLSNWQVQRAWTRMGMEPNSAYYTFHKWFD